MNIEALYQSYLQYPSIQTDTRKIQEGDLFFSLKGANFNGNKFAKEAIDKGASRAIIDDDAFLIPEKTILVENSLQALQLLAKHHRQQFTIPFIAITGSNGKTTTKELIHAVLSSSYKTYTTEGNLNNHIGVPLTILKIRSDAEFAVIEMGANHLQEIDSYCQIATPTHGLITNCGKAHLEGFGSEENIRKGKGELFDFLRHHNGGAFVMWDYEYLQELSKGIQIVYKYGTHDADIIGNIWKNDPFLQVNFTKSFLGTIKTKLIGNYNLPNVLAAVAVGKFFKVDDEKILEAIETYLPSNNRSQLQHKGTNKIILDAYNANPNSMSFAIENFSAMKGENKTLILGAMAELGEESFKEHQLVLNKIKEHEWKNVLLVGSDFENLCHSFLQFSSSSEAGEWLKQKNIQNSFLLIKGSRTTQMEKVLDYLED